jgi:hypothetical protein
MSCEICGTTEDLRSMQTVVPRMPDEAPAVLTIRALTTRRLMIQFAESVAE